MFINYNSIHSSECIGLGEVCTVAAALEAFNLRNAAYPFDWTISEYESICKVLQEDFKDFLHLDYLSVRSDFHGIINKYGLVFVHDFPPLEYTGALNIDAPITGGILHPNWMNALPEIEKKYLRRIERFRDVCKSNKKVYFIRHQGIRSQNDAITLRDILKRSYPNLDFTLVIIGNDDSFNESWNLPHIKNYYLKQTAVWNDVKSWQVIFEDLGLIANLKKINAQERMDYYCKKYNTPREGKKEMNLMH